MITKKTIILEILYNVRGADEAPGGVRAGVPDRAPLPHLAARHLTPLRELHHAAHHTQHHPAHVQGKWVLEYHETDLIRRKICLQEL